MAFITITKGKLRVKAVWQALIINIFILGIMTIYVMMN